MSSQPSPQSGRTSRPGGARRPPTPGGRHRRRDHAVHRAGLGHQRPRHRPRGGGRRRDGLQRGRVQARAAEGRARRGAGR